MMHRTMHTLPVETREAMIGLLNGLLADVGAAGAAAKHAHWTVRGPGFQAVHELFDVVAALVFEHADLVAERIQQLGGHARGTLEATAGAVSLPAYPLDAVTVQDHVEALAKMLATLSGHARAGIDTAADAGDQATADLLTEVVRGLDKHVWFIEAHLA